MGDSLNNDTPETYMWAVQDLENDRGLPNLPKAYRLYNKYSPRLICFYMFAVSIDSYI